MMQRLLAALCLALLATPPVWGQGEDRVTVTFRLTLYGEVPAKEAFEVVFTGTGQLDPAFFALCGDRSTVTDTPPGEISPPCEGAARSTTRRCPSRGALRSSMTTGGTSLFREVGLRRCSLRIRSA